MTCRHEEDGARKGAFQRAAVVDARAAESPARTGTERRSLFWVAGDLRRSAPSTVTRGDRWSQPAEWAGPWEVGTAVPLFLGEEESRRREASRGKG